MKPLHIVYHVRSDDTFAPTVKYHSTLLLVRDIMTIDNAQNTKEKGRRRCKAYRSSQIQIL